MFCVTHKKKSHVHLLKEAEQLEKEENKRYVVSEPVFLFCFYLSVPATGEGEKDAVAQSVHERVTGARSFACHPPQPMSDM